MIWANERHICDYITGRAVDDENIGHCFMAWRIDAFRDPTDFFADLQAMLAELPATPPATADGTTHVLVPGDPEIAAERENDLVVPANPGS